MPIAILTKGSMAMDEYNQYYLDYYKKVYSGQKSIPTQYFFTLTRYGYLSSYPIATGLLLTPFYAVPVFFYSLTHPTTAQWVFFSVVAEKISASAITAATAVLFFLIAGQLGASRLVAWMLSLAYAFGSEAWSTSSQALWQHGPGILLMLAACLAAFSCDDRPAAGKAVLVGLLCGIAAAIRPTNLLFCLPLLIWFWMRHTGYFFWSVVFFAAIVSAVGAYNIAVFGDFRGGYAQPLNGDFLKGFSGILFSPARGLLPYFPLSAFGIVGYVLGLRSARAHAGFCSVLMVFVVSLVLLVSVWPMWWGGYSFGPRLLAETQPMLLLMSVPVFASTQKIRLRWALFAVFLFWSVFIQVVGAFIYPAGMWNSSPQNIDKVPSRVWDWRDNPVGRDLRAFYAMQIGK